MTDVTEKPARRRSATAAGPAACRGVGVVLLQASCRVAVFVGVGFWSGRASTSCATPMPTGSLVIGVALVVGVGGVFALFWGMNRVVDFLPGRFARRRAAVRLHRARGRASSPCSSSIR